MIKVDKFLFLCSLYFVDEDRSKGWVMLMCGVKSVFSRDNSYCKDFDICIVGILGK